MDIAKELEQLARRNAEEYNISLITSLREIQAALTGITSTEALRNLLLGERDA